MSQMLRLFCTLSICLLIFTHAALAAPPMSILLDGFEAGIGAWQTNDSAVAGTGRLATLCGIYPSGDTPPTGGAQSAMLDFQPAKEAWATISLPIDGNAWETQKIGEISLWVKAPIAGSQVWMVLRASVPGAGGTAPEDRSYFMQIQPTGTDWQRMTLQVWGFETADGINFTKDITPHLYMLQFAKSGAWRRGRILIDSLQASPRSFPPNVTRPPSQPLTVDFRQNIGRSLTQIGFNFTPQAFDTLTAPLQRTALKKLTKDLTPCVGRVRLADYYVARTGSFDITRLNADVNWLISAGVKPLICLNMPSPAASGRDTRELYTAFENTCITLVELRRGTDIRPYYELFEQYSAPNSTDVSDLVAAYNHIEAKLRVADSTARIGGPGFTRSLQWPIREFTNNVNSLHFLSTQLTIDNTIWPGDQSVFRHAQSGASASDTEWTYSQLASWLQTRIPGTEAFITDWGVRRQTSKNSSAALQQESAEAVFLASSALAGSRYIDKMLWDELTDSAAGLVDTTGHPRSAYWAAWLIAKYAPRGATCTTSISIAPDVLITAFRTPSADNVFIVNHTPWPNAITFKAIGAGEFQTVRERKLDPAAAKDIQHRNLALTTTQTVSFQGPGVSVIQFIKQ